MHGVHVYRILISELQGHVGRKDAIYQNVLSNNRLFVGLAEVFFPVFLKHIHDRKHQFCHGFLPVKTVARVGEQTGPPA